MPIINIEILFIIFLTSIIQSIFGTGVLLFGTPLMLILGYDFQYSLSILLPTSILINLSQLNNKLLDIDLKFYKKLVLYSIPLITIFLYFVSVRTININSFIGIFLIIIALKEHSKILKQTINSIIKHEKIYLILMGIIHGITNLGGALLSAIVYSKNLNKYSTRATIAVSYLTFATFQIITLSFFLEYNDFFNKTNLIYWVIGLFNFFIVEKFLFIKINEKIYSKFFTFFIFIIGSILTLKN